MAVERTVTVQHPEGLHARPAAVFVQMASRYASEIEVEAKGQKASAKSILGVLKLGVSRGEAVTLRAEGTDEEAAVEGLAAFLAGDTDGGRVT